MKAVKKDGIGQYSGLVAKNFADKSADPFIPFIFFLCSYNEHLKFLMIIKFLCSTYILLVDIHLFNANLSY